MRGLVIRVALVVMGMGMIGILGGLAQEPQHGGTLRWATRDIAPSLDPHHNMGYGQLPQYIAFNRLMHYNPDTLEIEPELAVSWEILEDNVSYVFHLRQGVKYHDGGTFNAYDAKWNFERMLSDYSQVRNRVEMIKEIEVIDGYTIKLVLEKPFGPFLDNLMTMGIRFVSPRAVEAMGNEAFQKHPVGTGPFKFVEWDEQKGVLTFEDFEDYWGGRPYLDKWIFVEIPDDQTRLAAFIRGDVDVIHGVPAANVDQLLSDQRFNVFPVLAKSNTIDYITFNCAKPPFNDVRVRQAIAYALDEEALVEFLPHTEPIYGPLPPASWGANPVIGESPYDVEEAKRLLAEAGYPDGFSVTLKIWSNDPVRVSLAEVVQSMLAQVGIKVDIQILETSTLIETMRKGGAEADWEMASLHWGGGGALDPNGNLRVLFHSSMGQYNWIANYHSIEVDRLLDEALVTVDYERRKALYQTAYTILVHDAPMVWFGRFVTYKAAWKYVHGIDRLAPTGYFVQQPELVWVEGK